jgi:hypothetical protein
MEKPNYLLDLNLISEVLELACFAPYTANIDRTSGAITVSIDSFVPEYDCPRWNNAF